MGKVGTPKERHERRPKGSQALKEACQCPFSADRIADEQHEKINRFIVAEVAAHQADLVAFSQQKSFCGEVLGEESNFGKPWRN